MALPPTHRSVRVGLGGVALAAADEAVGAGALICATTSDCGSVATRRIAVASRNRGGCVANSIA